jgi:hypothetical protein
MSDVEKGILIIIALLLVIIVGAYYYLEFKPEMALYF